MQTLSVLLFLSSFLLLLIGVISPKTSLFWYKKDKTRKKSFSIYLSTVIISFILVGVTADKKGKTSNDSSNTTSQVAKSEPAQVEKASESPSGVKVGQVLKTEYFDIVVNNVALKDRVDTGNQFADKKPELGNKFLILNASFKNTNNESRYLNGGSVWINYNGKDYEFSKSETIMLEGWGLLLTEINPLTVKTTNLVYKIPAEIKGNAFWQPGRATSDQRILLGTL